MVNSVQKVQLWSLIKESSGNSGASQRSKQLGYFFEKYIE